MAKDLETITLTNKEPDTITIQGFVSTIRVGKSVSFLVLRDGLHTLQCVAVKKPLGDLYELITKLSLESFVKLKGKVESVPKPIKTCTISTLELHISGVEIISHAEKLPFSIQKDLGVDEPSVNYTLCLNHRSLDLRSFHSSSIFRVVDGFMFYFRSFLRKKKFIEIKTSKLIESSSEGGANVFKVDYFKTHAYLAQSPQLYKQLAILGGLKRVYEIGHVYRAEESNINRYLSEFVGMDIEMEIEEDYSEVYLLVYEMITNIINNIFEEYKDEIEHIRKYQPFENLKFNKEPVIFTWEECCELLKEKNIEVNGDFNREQEKQLGAIVKHLREVDIFIIKEYPTEVRAFYTQPMENSKYSRSYDIIIRGEEVLSGAQRIHNYEDLKKSAERCGIKSETIEGYLEAFKYGVPKHGGVGIGLERLVKTVFDFKDIRYFNMFPRDPNRLNP